MLALHAILAAGLLAVAVYAQHRVPYHTKGRPQVFLIRIVLAAVGIACGYVAAAYSPQAATKALAFVQGFGLVHVPAAFILFLKRAQARS